MKSSCFAWPIHANSIFQGLCYRNDPIPRHSQTFPHHPVGFIELPTAGFPLTALGWETLVAASAPGPAGRFLRCRQRRQRRLHLGSRRCHLSLLGPEATVDGLGFARFSAQGSGKIPDLYSLGWGKWTEETPMLGR